LEFLGETDLTEQSAADTIGAVVKDRDDLEVVTRCLQDVLGHA
jgi:hypothetical protein